LKRPGHFPRHHIGGVSKDHQSFGPAIIQKDAEIDGNTPQLDRGKQYR
jgi:hypothetical protein